MGSRTCLVGVVGAGLMGSESPRYARAGSDVVVADLTTAQLDRCRERIATSLDQARRGLAQALSRAGMTIDDVDLVEINEAFAAQVLPSARDLGLDPSTRTRSTSTAERSPSAIPSA